MSQCGNERAFTEHFPASSAALALSKSISPYGTFVQLRRLMDTNRDLARKIEALEKKYDEQFTVVFKAIKQLIATPDEPRKQIGFHP